VLDSSGDIATNLVIAKTHRLTLFRAGVDASQRALDRVDASPSVTVLFQSAEDHAAARRWRTRLAPRPMTYRMPSPPGTVRTVGITSGFGGDFLAAEFTRFAWP
jgi:hypothetical protein